MDWFEKLTGFGETSYDDTRAKLRVDGRQLRSLINGKTYGIGELELVSLQTLREVLLRGPTILRPLQRNRLPLGRTAAYPVETQKRYAICPRYRSIPDGRQGSPTCEQQSRSGVRKRALCSHRKPCPCRKSNPNILVV
jgi:hypothetical protein